MAREGVELGQSGVPQGRLRNRVSIYVCEDGSVVFGDLPPALAEVAALVSGEVLANRPELVLDCPVDPLCQTPDTR